MATTDQDETPGKHAAQETLIGGDMSATIPLSTDPLCPNGVVSNHNIDQAFKTAHVEGTELTHTKNDLPAVEEDQMRTPKLEQPPLAIESLASKLSEPVQNDDQQSYRGLGDEDIIMSRHPEYFLQKILQDSVVADISRTPSSSNVSSTGLSGSTHSPSSTAVSPDSRASAWKDYMPPYNPESNRPVSVPNFKTKTLSPRRDGPDYPSYPDQSFKALQNQHHPPPYQPGESHHEETRPPHPPQNTSFPSSGETYARGYPPLPSGAKTVGNTPAQSPGLFTPTLTKKHWSGEPDDSRSGTPMLHPAHLQAPKE